MTKHEKELRLGLLTPPSAGTYMCGDEGRRVGQLVMPPHPEGEEDDGGQAYDGNQGVEQGAEELGLLGERVGSGCEVRERAY